MKRRENMLSSSSSTGRETISVNHQTTKNVGCMSGIFHLVSKYQNRRKLLTSAKHQEKSTITNTISLSSSPTTKPRSSESSESKSIVMPKSDSDFKRFSCEISRSPTIPSEIRLSRTSIGETEEETPQQRSPALIARLMGLNDLPPVSPSPSLISSSSEKRRKLMVALEKCDEDLKSLKNIIESIQSTKIDHHHNDHRHRTSLPLPPAKMKTGSRRIIVRSRASSYEEDPIRKEKSYSDDGNSSEVTEQPSPVSVLDQISSTYSPPTPPLNNHRRSSLPIQAIHHHNHHQYQIGEKYKKLREEGNSFSLFHRITFEALPKLSSSRGVHDHGRIPRLFSSPLTMTNNPGGVLEPVKFQRNNKAKVVNEACLDAVCAERWELGRIGVVLEDYIFEELIEEVVRDLGFSRYSYLGSSLLPLEACRKRLRF